MSKILDLSRTVYELCSKDPQVTEIMRELGFEQITAPASLNTVGRFMTIPKGADMRGIDLGTVKQKFRERGYEIKE